MPIDLPKRPLTTLPFGYERRQAFSRDAVERAAANGGEGWVYWKDGARATRANAIQIPANVRTQVMIDGADPASTDEFRDTIPPKGLSTTLLSNSVVQADTPGDTYLARVGFEAAIIPPALDTGEVEGEILLEYDVGGFFNVHEARKPFMSDPGPVLRERNGMDATIASLGGVLAVTLAPLNAQRALVEAQWQAARSDQTASGEKFIETGFYFAGQPVIDQGVRFFVTPNVDVELWGADVFVARLASPTE